jgi:hypothetical protein
MCPAIRVNRALVERERCGRAPAIAAGRLRDDAFAMNVIERR